MDAALAIDAVGEKTDTALPETADDRVGEAGGVAEKEVVSSENPLRKVAERLASIEEPETAEFARRNINSLYARFRAVLEKEITEREIENTLNAAGLAVDPDTVAAEIFHDFYMAPSPDPGAEAGATTHRERKGYVVDGYAAIVQGSFDRVAQALKEMGFASGRLISDPSALDRYGSTSEGSLASFSYYDEAGLDFGEIHPRDYHAMRLSSSYTIHGGYTIHHISGMPTNMDGFTLDYLKERATADGAETYALILHPDGATRAKIALSEEPPFPPVAAAAQS
ncbi:MAG: hypothetical protein UZ22_OP11002000969 [Microgenomates bacterium OLB23]|nr:MAG: hypothetical protein UZ22_OP11002000969 [Microgenomates bacterium OLB23]